MLLCKEQEKEFIFGAKKIVVSDKYLNAYFIFHDMMLDKIAVSVFLSTYKNGLSKEDIVDTRPNEELSLIVETGIKSEIFELMQKDFDEFWINIPE